MVIHAGGEEHIARASDEREDTRARDGRRGISSERVDARTDSLEAPGRPEGGALGSVIGRCQCAAGPEERRGQAQQECPVKVSDLDFILCIRLLDPPILLT